MKTVFPTIPEDSAGARQMWLERHMFVYPFSPVVIHRPQQMATAMHRHAFTELVFITNGHGIHDIEGVAHELAPGDFFVMEGARAHAYRETDRLELVNVLIRDRVMAGLRPVLEKLHGYDSLFAGIRAAGNPFVMPRRLRADELDDCLALVEKIEQETGIRAEGCHEMQTALALQLMITMIRLVPGQVEGVADARARLGKTIRLLEQNYAGEIALSRMERIACMSPRSLQRHFVEVTGTTPMQYLKCIRMAHACRLLRETNLSITEIGERCGIPDSAYFCRLFSQFTGKSPSGYRRMNA